MNEAKIRERKTSGHGVQRFVYFSKSNFHLALGATSPQRGHNLICHLNIVTYAEQVELGEVQIDNFLLFHADGILRLGLLLRCGRAARCFSRGVLRRRGLFLGAGGFCFVCHCKPPFSVLYENAARSPVGAEFTIYSFILYVQYDIIPIVSTSGQIRLRLARDKTRATSYLWVWMHFSPAEVPSAPQSYWHRDTRTQCIGTAIVVCMRVCFVVIVSSDQVLGRAEQTVWEVGFVLV